MSKDIFKNNPNLKEVFITSDETAFYERNPAENHAKTLEDKTVTRLVNPSRKVSEVDIDAPENATLGLIQTGEDKDGNPDLKQIVAKIIEGENAELAVVPVNYAPADKTGNVIVVDDVDTDEENINPERIKDSVKWIEEPLIPAKDSNGEVKLTPKQQLQADYMQKFGETPAEQFTKNQLLEAIEKGEKLVTEIKAD